jgi:hypothetical protein
MKPEFSKQNFEKSQNIKFHKNPCIGSRLLSSGRTDMTKLIAAFRNFANMPKNWHLRQSWTAGIKDDKNLNSMKKPVNT